MHHQRAARERAADLQRPDDPSRDAESSSRSDGLIAILTGTAKDDSDTRDRREDQERRDEPRFGWKLREQLEQPNFVHAPEILLRRAVSRMLRPLGQSRRSRRAGFSSIARTPPAADSGASFPSERA